MDYEDSLSDLSALSSASEHDKIVAAQGSGKADADAEVEDNTSETTELSSESASGDVESNEDDVLQDREVMDPVEAIIFDFNKAVERCHSIIPYFETATVFNSQEDTRKALQRVQEQMDGVRAAHESAKAGFRALAWRAILRDKRSTPMWEDWLTQVIPPQNARFRVALRPLKTCYNNFMPISRLPKEVFREILYWSVLYHHFDEPPRNTYRRYEPWASFSYVCTRWRSTSLDIPVLWCCIDCTSDHWVSLVLPRSKKVPLRVRAWPGDSSYSEEYRESFEVVCKKAGNRVHTVYLQHERGSLQYWMNAMGSFRQLHELYVDKDHGGNGPRTELPTSVQTRKAPLRRLSWNHPDGFVLPHSSTFRNLIVLNLTFATRSSQSHRYQVSEVLECLKEALALEELRLAGSIITDENGSPDISSLRDVRVELPSMTKLCLCAGMRSCSQFLRHVEFPPHASLEVIATAVTANDNVHDHLALIAAKKAVQLVDLGRLFYRCSIELTGRSVVVRGWPNTSQSFENLPPCQLGLGLHCLLKFASGDKDKVWANHAGSPLTTPAILQRLPIERTEVLEIRRLCEVPNNAEGAVMDTEDAKNALRRFPSVRVLISRPTTEAGIFIAECLDPGEASENSASTSDQLVFPRLERVIIKETNFLLQRPGESDKWQKSKVAEPQTLDQSKIDNMRKCLENRRNWGAPVRFMSFEQCKGVSAERADTLSDLADIFCDEQVRHAPNGGAYRFRSDSPCLSVFLGDSDP